MTSAPRSSLVAAKLRALADEGWGPADRTPVDLPLGAALVDDDAAWVLVDGDPLKSFGPALVWGARRGAATLHLIVDDSAAVLERRARCFDRPPEVWRVAGTAVERAIPAAAPTREVAPSAPALAELLVDADLEVVVEAGIVRGEVLGLEVARIVHGTTSTGTPIDAPQLEVGVGGADREMTAMVHAGLSPVQQLARVAEIVRGHRRPDAPRHPLNQLAPERWLRAVLIADPARLGLRHLAPLAPAVPRPNLRDRAVAMAVGEDHDGHPTIVACSVGVDLDLVPAAADARLAVDPAARLLLAVPERDAHPITTELAQRLVHPAELVPIGDGWRDSPSQ